MSKLWKILNTKSPSAHLRLNDNDRRPIRSREHDNFNFVSKTAETFESMGGGVGMSRHLQLTSNTSAAFCVTLRGICGIAEYLLSYHNCSYILPGAFQSDELEGEFGINRGMSGSSYLSQSINF